MYIHVDMACQCPAQDLYQLGPYRGHDPVAIAESHSGHAGPASVLREITDSDIP